MIGSFRAAGNRFERETDETHSHVQTESKAQSYGMAKPGCQDTVLTPNTIKLHSDGVNMTGEGGE